MEKIKIALADDHKIFRQGLETILGYLPNYEVVISAEDGKVLLDAMEKTTVDVAILDISMPNMNGEEAAKYISKNYPSTKIIMLSMHDELHWVKAMLNAGAMGYLAKNTGAEEFIEAIETVLDNRLYIHKNIKVSSEDLAKMKNEKPNFTDAEMQVIKLDAQAITNQQVAKIMGIGIKKLEYIKTVLYKKTGTKNSKELMLYAVKNKLVEV